MADDDYKGRSGAASYSARKTYRSSPKVTNKKQYKDKTTDADNVITRQTIVTQKQLKEKKKSKEELERRDRE